MSDIRRSSRSNKGKNTRLEDQVKYEELISQRSKRIPKNSKADGAAAGGDANVVKGDDADDDDGEDEVLCTVCGTTDDNYDEEDDDRDMIQCEECLSWQHTECIFGKKTPPKFYKCNVCDPNNHLYKDLTFELDPETIMLKKRKHRSIAKTNKGRADNDEDDDDGDDYKSNEKNNEDDDELSDNDNPEDRLSDDEYKVDKQESRSSLRKRSRSKSSDSVKVERKRSRQSSQVTNKIEDSKHLEIELKARDAVKKRFEGMFQKLLVPGTKIPNETDSLDELSIKWAKKLEDELFNVYHNPENGKLTTFYKEVSTRIFVNVKDEKNLKLRNSIINKQIPFTKLIKMPVNELLNPDLQREKEEAIKESMTQATIEAPLISNIRRTHKGDIVLEKEDNLSNQQYDFNVGLNIDNDDKKFTKSKNIVINDRKNSNIYNDTRQFDDEIDHEEEETTTIGDGNEHKRSRSNSIVEDDALLEILGETEKDVQNQNQKHIESNNNNEFKGLKLWEGQTIFVGMTNFASEIKFIETTLDSKDVNKISSRLFPEFKPLEIEGRLDFHKADKYIETVSKSRKLVLMELQHSGNGEHNERNFQKLFDYFHSRSKCGVIKTSESFIKDGYLIASKTPHDLPKFFKHFPSVSSSDYNHPKLYIIFIIKKELIKDLNSPIQPQPQQITQQPISQPPINVPSNEFLSKLSPNVLELVNKIFDEYPETRVDSNLLINYLKKRLSNGI